MSSSSAAARPFTGRLRSSARPGSASFSKGLPPTSAVNKEDGSIEPGSSPRMSTSHSSSPSFCRHGGNDLVPAHATGPGSRLCCVASHRALDYSVTTEDRASAAPAGTADSGVNHCNNGGVGETDCGLLTSVEHVDRDATQDVPEDKRAARRRRRAEAAAAAAAAALSIQKAIETGSSERDGTRWANATGRCHHEPARVQPADEWRPGQQSGEAKVHEPSTFCTSASFSSRICGKRTEQYKLLPEASLSTSDDIASGGGETGGGELKGPKATRSAALRTAPAEPSSSSADWRSSDAAPESAADREGNAEAADDVCAVLETSLAPPLVSVGAPTAPQDEPVSSASIHTCSVTGDSIDRELSASPGLCAAANCTRTDTSTASDGTSCEPNVGNGDFSVVGAASAPALESSGRDKCICAGGIKVDGSTVSVYPCSAAEESPTNQDMLPSCGSKKCEAACCTAAPSSAQRRLRSCFLKAAVHCSFFDAARGTEQSSRGADSSGAAEAVASERRHLTIGPLDGRPSLEQAENHFSADTQCLLQDEHRDCTQNIPFDGDEQRRCTAAVSIPCSSVECPTNFDEKTERSATSSGAPLASCESAAVLSDTSVVNGAEASATSTVPTKFHLTPVFHGLQCLRGELLLNRQEFEILQSFLRPLFYRFVPCASPNECLTSFHDRISRVHYTCGGLARHGVTGCSPVPVHREGKTSSRRLAQELHALQQAACAFTALPPRGGKRRREPKIKVFPDDEADVGSATYSSSHSSGGSLCSTGTHRRDYEGTGEDGSGSREDSVFTQGTGARRRQRSRKLTLHVEEDTGGEQGAVEITKGGRRSERMGVFGGDTFERVASVDSDGDVSSAVSGISRRRVRGSSSSSWKRRKSVEEGCEGSSFGSKRQSSHVERQAGRGSIRWEGSRVKTSYVEAEKGAGTAGSRGLALRQKDSKAHRRRYLLEDDGCGCHRRLKNSDCDTHVEETATPVYASRRLWGNRQRKRTGGTVPSSGEGGNDRSSKFAGCYSTSSLPSPSLYVSSTTDWRESCYLILQHLKRQPSARWFLSQDCDAASGYADSSAPPLSFGKIEQKLMFIITRPKLAEVLPTSESTDAAPRSEPKGYMHPSQWQQEVRQIFFNAFTYHPMYHEIWRDAAILAAEFERCCRLVHEVNPYYPAMLKHQRLTSRAYVPGAAGSSGLDRFPGMTGAPTVTAVNNAAHLPTSYRVLGGTSVEAPAKAPEARRSFAGDQVFSATGVSQHSSERVSLVGSPPVQPSRCDRGSICHQQCASSVKSLSGAAAAGVFASAAIYEGSATVGYSPSVSFLRADGRKTQGASRPGRVGTDGGFHSKRQQQLQHEADMPEGRGATEDLGVTRKPERPFMYAYGGQYREPGVGLLGDEGGKNRRMISTVASGSPRRGGRGGGRGRGAARGGRGSASTNELQGSAASQQQPRSRYSWTNMSGQGVGVVPENGFLGPLVDLQPQAFSSCGRMLPVGVGSGGHPANEGDMMLMGGAGLPTTTGFTVGGTVAGAGASTNVLLLNSNAGLDPIHHMEAPPGAPVLPPPPVPRIGVNDKPLSSSQRRTLEQNMQRLSPLQRKAALELIQDDLGILAAEYMNVKAFAFDTELLSIEKQKRLFAYVNSMFRANREILLRQHQQQVAAAHAAAMAAADSACEAVQQQPRGVRRGRRKKGEGGSAAGVGGTQLRSGTSSSSSSGSDSDSSSSLSSSDSSSSTSSSDTEEEGSEDSENEVEYCQKATPSTTQSAPAAVLSREVSGADTENGTLPTTEKGGRTGTGEPLDIRAAKRGREQLSEETSAASALGVHGSSGEVQECSSRRVNDSVDRAESELTSRAIEAHAKDKVAAAMVGLPHGTQGLDGTCDGARQGAAQGDERAFLPGTAGRMPEYYLSESLKGERLLRSPNTTDLSSSGNSVSRGNNQGLKGSSRDSHGSMPFHGGRSDPPHGGGPRVSSCDPTALSACAPATSTNRPSPRTGCSITNDAEKIMDISKCATGDGHGVTATSLGPYGPLVPSKTSAGGGRTLPQYTPVCEEAARVEIRAEVIGRHADFLGMLAVREAGSSSENEGARMGDCGAKPTAWQEWKGQVIQQGFVAQRAYASQQQRSVSEIIAERYNARI